MIIKSATFVCSNTNPAKCPAPDKPEYAFIGRSNVGKSSLINLLAGRKGLAKISGHPGKTRTINHFLINEVWYLVDLPGYGYARISKTERETFPAFTKAYLKNRENLMCLFVLIDSRLKPQASDLNLISFLGSERISFMLVFTKADKLTVNVMNINLQAFRKSLLVNWEELPGEFITSSVSGKGREELLNFIQQTNLLFNHPGIMG
ncbi:MAG: ribosome biogenesis GTP-binding protein YihA/YsxC [Bacteroidota bacterium]